MIRTVIIDDEDHIRDSLEKLLARHCPQVMICGTACSVASGIRIIQEMHPDLVLLDIEMKESWKLAVGNHLKQLAFPI